MKIFFCITGYKRPDQFNWLYRAIYNEDDIFLIHIDEKSPASVHRDFREITDAHPNTHFVPSIPIVWGGTGLIQSEIAAIKQALDIAPDWRYLVNLTAQDYPLVSLAEMRSRLSEAWPANFVDCKPLKAMHWRIRKRLWFRHVEYNYRRYITPIPRFPVPNTSINWYGVWWHVLSRSFCEWWTKDRKAELYYQALRPAGMPDELLIQNLIQDSPFRHTVVPESKHEIIWCDPGEPIRTTAHPNILTMRYKRHLERSRAFFARKFDRDVDEDILQVLAKRVGMGELPKTRLMIE